MVDVGQVQAQRLGTTNVRWQVGYAEDVDTLAGSFELITIGEAFHRLDQRLIAGRALIWLQTGGCLATLGGSGVFEGSQPWQALGRAVLDRWEIAHPGAGCPVSGPVSHPNEQVLRAAGFVDVVSQSFLVPYVWSLEAILGNLFSTSVASPRVLDNRAADFTADLRQTLLASCALGHYPATLSFGYTLARRPPDR